MCGVVHIVPCLQLCHLAVALSAQRGERSVYFDTTNSFSAARVRQLTDVADNEVSTVACSIADTSEHTHCNSSQLHLVVWAMMPRASCAFSSGFVIGRLCVGDAAAQAVVASDGQWCNGRCDCMTSFLTRPLLL